VGTSGTRRGPSCVAAVDVTWIWGERIVRVERWHAGCRELALGEARLVRDGRGRPALVHPRAREPVALQAGVPVDVVVEELTAPYRTHEREAVVARVELATDAALPRVATTMAPATRTSALAALALHVVVLIVCAIARPARSARDATTIASARSFVVAGAELPEPVSTAAPEVLRRRHDVEGTCRGLCARADSAAFGPTEPEDAIGLAEPAPSCAPARRVHEVAPGETLIGIARTYGFDDFHALYNESENPRLVRQRPDPNRIEVGDLVLLPAGSRARFCFDS
jgi:hypothetical protein